MPAIKHSFAPYDDLLKRIHQDRCTSWAAIQSDFLIATGKFDTEYRSGDHSESHHHHFKADQDHVLLSTAVEHTEKEVIKEVLQKARTRSEAIKILGISRRTFYTKLKQYNLA